MLSRASAMTCPLDKEGFHVGGGPRALVSIALPLGLASPPVLTG